MNSQTVLVSMKGEYASELLGNFSLSINGGTQNAWPFLNVDCTPPWKEIKLLVAQCGSQQVALLFWCYYSAYQYALTAWRTLAYAATQSLDLRRTIWYWGYQVGMSALWDGSAESQFAGLHYWFGPYSHKKFNRILTIFTKMKEYYEKSVVQTPVTYRCKTFCDEQGTPARHLIKPEVAICPRFWKDGLNPTPAERNRMMSTILHEGFHGVKSFLQLRDVTHPGCSGGWNVQKNQCYRSHALGLDFGNGGELENPRRLVLLNATSHYMNNVDNYLCWAVRRMRDIQFGGCNAPHPPWTPGTPKPIP